MIGMQEKLVSDEIRRLVPVLGRENAARLSRAYLLADEDTKQRIFELVDVIKAAVFADPDLKSAILREPPNPAESKGEIVIGDALYGRKRLYPFAIKKQDLLAHLGVFGSSGYGKTNIAYTLIERLSDQNVPVIVFDFSKRNYKDLLATRLRDRIDLFTIGRNVSPFRFNPLLPPPGIQLSQWMKEFSSIFDHAYWLLGGGRAVILKALDNVFLENQHPRMQDLRRWLADYGTEGVSSRERNWLATAERPLESLCFKEIGEVFDVAEGSMPSDFFRPGRVTVLELDALDVNDKTFFIEIILQWIRDWLLVKGQKEQLQAVVILEEAHHVLNREKSRKLGSETVMELLFREVRELGMGIVYLDQHPSLVSFPALGNTSTHIYMNLGLDTRQSSDIQDASNMLGLDEEETPYLRLLPVGHGLIMCRMSLREPFAIGFPRYPLEKGKVTDEDIARIMKARLPPVRPQRAVAVLEVEEPDEQGMKIVQALGAAAGSFASQIYTQAKMSGKTFEKSAGRLIETGLVGRKKAKIGRNVLHFFFLTEAGDKVFDAHFPRPQQRSTKDISLVISNLEEAGWIFDRQGEKLIFEDANKRMVVAIETSPDRTKIRADLRETPHFICVTEGVRNALLQEAARAAYESGSLTVFVAAPEQFARKADFERIEFR